MAKKITRPEMLSILESKIAISRRIMENERDTVWKKCREFFEGPHWPEKFRHRLFTLNLIWSTVRTKLAQLYFKNPEFSLKAKKPEFDGPLKQLSEAILNYHTERAYMKQVMRTCIQAAFTDLAIITWGCDTDFKQADQSFTQQGFNIDQPVPKRDSFYFKRIMPENFFPDHSSGEQIFEKLPGFGVKELMRKEEVKKRYGVKEKDIDARESVVDMDRLDDLYKSTGLASTPIEITEELKRVEVYKYYDNEKGKLFIFGSGHKDFFDISNYSSEWDIPYAVLKYDEKCQGFYPIPEIKHYIDPQTILEIAMSMLTEHMKRSARKYQSKKGALDPKAKQDLENPATGVLIELAAQGKIDPVELGNADSSIYQNASWMEALFNQIAGMSTSRRGGEGTKLTATAEAIIDKMQMNRSSDRMALITDFISKVGNGFQNCLQRNLTIPDIIQITDEQGAMMWVQYIPTIDLVGDYECKVTVGDSAPKDDALERAQWIDCLSVLQANPIIMMSPILIEETLIRFNIDSPRLRDELLKLGQLMMQQQIMGMTQSMMAGAGNQGKTPSKAGQTAGANVKV